MGKNMKKIFAFGTLAVALAGAAFLTPTEPAAAKEYEFCRFDYSSGMRTCAFGTIEQCVAMISGRGGSCVRSPVGGEASAAYAYAPKAQARHHH